MTVVVFGSINMDLVVRTPRFPAPGETLSGHTFYTVPGGKGANQAVACARLGANTLMVGRVGGDMFGEALLESLRQNQVQTDSVWSDASSPSGTAMITVDDRAENMIILVAGANGQMGAEDLNRLQGLLSGADRLLLQLEVPMETVLAAARLARQSGVQVILDPAPARELPDELYQLVDIITPNESEAAALVGFPLSNEEAVIKAAEALQNRGVGQVIIKLGGKGIFWREAANGQFLPAYKIQPVDTVAAGDAFNGGLAAALDAGLTMRQALSWGMAAGAISATRPGAQTSLPTRQELLEFLTQQG